jgi:hypothetical protein
LVKDPDNLTEDGAGVLARCISKYWFARGHVILTWVEPIMINQRTKVFGVRSSLVNGLPTAAGAFARQRLVA